MFDAAEEMGLRFYGAPYVFSSQGESDGDMCDLSIWNELYDRWHGAGGDRIRVAMSPHATDTCSPDLLQSACARAAELDIPLTIHVAQSRDEVDTIRRRHGGRSPVEYLDWLGLLRPNMLAAHCVECSDNDLSLLAARDVTILNCPRTLARAGVTASYARFAAHGVRTLVATDGYNMDIVSELGAAALISKTSSGRADVASASELVDAVTRQAAKAIGRDDLGVIRKGASADLTVLDLSGPYLNPLHDPLRAMVTLGNRADVETVMVDGRLLVREGRFQLGDEGNIVSAGAAAVAKIWNLPEARRAFDREGPAA
jgi:cytosine/adenosine deaminase-related metal-dependent hydrolase